MECKTTPPTHVFGAIGVAFNALALKMNEDTSPVVKYVGHCVSKVRWKPQPAGFIGSSDVFASGTTGEEVCINWKYTRWVLTIDTMVACFLCRWTGCVCGSTGRGRDLKIQEA